MEVVHSSGWNLYPRLDRGCIEIKQAVGPAIRPRLHQRSRNSLIEEPKNGRAKRKYRLLDGILSWGQWI